MEQKRQFQLNLPDLLKVLAEHLYSSRKVAIRELIQNAHDSITRYQADGAPAGYRPRVDLTVDPESKRITIQDNGQGMTDQDIVQYLTTIGNSYTREFKERMEFRSPDKATQLIGQFGLGFLSAFLAASEVTLLTRSTKSDQGWRWFCDGSEFFDMRPADVTFVGTRVELTVKPEAEFLLEETVLTETIRQYADFLGVPIYLNNDPAPINLMTPPWEAPNRQQAELEYIERAFRQRNPICIIELRDQEIDLGHDTMVIPLRGFVYVPQGSVVSLQEYGDLNIYIRRMFIAAHERDLMPSWARFFRGVIDCPSLQPTVSRESLHQEDNYLAVQQALEQQLLEGLRNIAEDHPDIWKQIVISHTDLVLGWITVNQEFFEQVADLLPLRTSRGQLTMIDYLEQTHNTLYFVTREMGSLQEQVLGEGYEVPVIDASWFAVRPFLEKYASRHKGIQLVQMDGDARRLMRPVPNEDYTEILAFYKSQNIKAKVAAFKPPVVPALVLYPRNADTIAEAKRALDSNELSAPFAAMIQAYLDRQDDEAEANDDVDAATGVLYLNASSPLMRQMVETPPAPAVRDSVLTLLYQMARLFAARTMTAQDAVKAFEGASTAIKGLMK